MRPSSTLSSDRDWTPVQWCERFVSEPRRTTAARVRALHACAVANTPRRPAPHAPNTARPGASRRCLRAPRSHRSRHCVRPVAVSSKNLRAFRCVPAAASRRRSKSAGSVLPRLTSSSDQPCIVFREASTHSSLTVLQVIRVPLGKPRVSHEAGPIVTGLVTAVVQSDTRLV